jgi:hypothetical protein
VLQIAVFKMFSEDARRIAAQQYIGARVLPLEACGAASRKLDRRVYNPARFTTTP